MRRLVSLGFTHEVLKKSFRADPSYDIPTSVFLQDMTEVRILGRFFTSFSVSSLPPPVSPVLFQKVKARNIVVEYFDTG